MGLMFDLGLMKRCDMRASSRAHFIFGWYSCKCPAIQIVFQLYLIWYSWRAKTGRLSIGVKELHTYAVFAFAAPKGLALWQTCRCRF